MARDSIHSMMSHLPTLPALLEHARNLPPRKGFSPFQLAMVLIAGCLHAASMAWPFDFAFLQGQQVWCLQLLPL